MTQDSNSGSVVIAISNPRSGKNKRGGFEEFDQAIQKFPSIRHVISSHKNEIISALNSAKHNNTKIIIINGGDGTLQIVLTFLKQEENMNFQPELVLLKAGTTSMGFGDVGYKGNIGTVLAAIDSYAFGEKVKISRQSRQVLRMTLPQEGKSVCGMFFGAGAIYSGILYCRQNLHTKGVRGELGPTMAMFRFLIDWLTVKKLTASASASIHANKHQPFSGDFNIITATSLERLLVGIYPFWGQNKTTDTFALSLIKHGAPKPIKAALRILRGCSPTVEEQANYYRSYYVSKVSLEIDNGFTLDGELFGEQGKSMQVILESAGCVTFLTA